MAKYLTRPTYTLVTLSQVLLNGPSLSWPLSNPRLMCKTRRATWSQVSQYLDRRGSLRIPLYLSNSVLKRIYTPVETPYSAQYDVTACVPRLYLGFVALIVSR